MDWLIAVRSSVAEWILVARVVVGGSSPSSWPVLRAIVTLALPRRLTTKQPPPKKQRSGSKSQMASLLGTLLRFARGKPFWPNWPKTLRNSNTNIFVLLKTQKTCLLIVRSLGFVGSPPKLLLVWYSDQVFPISPPKGWFGSHILAQYSTSGRLGLNS